MTRDRDGRTDAPCPPPAGRPRRPDGRGLEAAARRRIGRALRALYGGLLDEPLPERFTALIAALPAAPTSKEGS
ncbi:NepR family anti-sigma factor [Methylobacterium organophilum]|uniref:Anti-sigma factor NepR domain-containing protein n=1 Tax=Methylobacterium organophilum TaxID=410 RepID=A0ABQ4TDS8_METOR|nr:NepR family anti-sigma factor [Methylobacterium organophilum]GJE29378.1 hypothetical protein LKMONMHP_4258 [Methylobacterium organophilum]